MSDLKENQEKLVQKENGFILLISHIYKKDNKINKWWEEEEFKTWLKLARGES